MAGHKRCQSKKLKLKKDVDKHIMCLDIVANGVKQRGISKEQRNAFIDRINKPQMTCFVNCIEALFRGDVTMKEQDLAKIKRYKKKIYMLKDSKVPMTKKKRILKQEGGGIFAPLLATVLPQLVSLGVSGIKKAIDKKKDKKDQK